MSLHEEVIILKRYLRPLLGLLVIALLISGCFGKKMMLTISTQGEGMVTKSPDDEGQGYKKDAVVQLIASPATGWRFARWEVDLTGDNPKTSVKMDSDKLVKAVFVKQEYPLEIIVEGEGTVSQEIITNKEAYEHGTTVKLTANPAAGWSFDHFEGDLTGDTNPATIVIDSLKSVKAVFKINNAQIKVPENFASIQAAINAANDGQTIIVSPGTYKENLNFNGKCNLTLVSTNPLDEAVVAGTIINGNQTGACVVVENAETGIFISGFTITNGSGQSIDETTAGGGVFASGSSVTITNCSISENTAKAWGGGIYASNATVNIVNSIISANRNAAHGGGVWAGSSSTITITNCTISGNLVTTAGGGINAFSANVTITSSTINNNTAHSGGGIYANSPSNVTITGTTINDNTANYGGGVKVYAASLTLDNSIINGNTAGYEGGGCYAEYATLNVIGCTISSNSTTRYQAGGIFINDRAKATITDSTISNNNATYGSGICVSGLSTLKFQNNTINGNIATTNGGGIWKSTDSNITNNNNESLTTPAAVEAINEFSNNSPDNVYFK